jgi:hypothetical protein
MQNSQMKRSKSIRLLLLGVATLAISGCQHLQSLSESPKLSASDVRCLHESYLEDDIWAPIILRGGFGHSAGHYGGGALG